jgi:S-adenosylmethionine:tRNA ribosyltransferase-isomerase
LDTGPELTKRDLEYYLPDRLIAQRPAPTRGDSRLMVLDRAGQGVSDSHFRNLPEYLRPGDILVLNDTRVFPARIGCIRSDTGGRAEMFLLKRQAGTLWKVLLRPGRHCRPGISLLAAGGLTATVMEGLGNGRALVGFSPEEGLDSALRAAGSVPLPPYIRRPADSLDAERYQTVYARNEGAVAAPTAGLHFTREMLQRLLEGGVKNCTVTLDVGPGTFEPLRRDALGENRLDPEEYHVPRETLEALRTARGSGGRIVSVGTTAARVLETVDLGREGPLSGETSLFIFPPYRFRNVDALLTNFHLPGSSLIALVAAFAGLEHVMGAYRRAVELGYRFYSYGDAMFLF